MDKFLDLCSRANAYPHNLLFEGIPEYTIDTLEDQLEKRSNKIFCPREEQSAVDIVEQLTLRKG